MYLKDAIEPEVDMSKFKGSAEDDGDLPIFADATVETDDSLDGPNYGRGTKSVDVTVTIGGSNESSPDPIDITVIHDGDKYEPEVTDVSAKEVSNGPMSSMQYGFCCEHDDISPFQKGDAAEIVVSDEDSSVVGSCRVEMVPYAKSADEVVWRTVHLGMHSDVGEVVEETGWGDS